MRALVLVLVVTVGACVASPLDDVPTDEAGAPLPSAGTATLRDGTIVLPPAMTKDAVVDLGDVVFPAAGNDALLELVRGNVIVSGTGDGFIRRVYAVAREGEAIRVITSPATLSDAVEHATFETTITEPFAFDDRIDAQRDTVTAAIHGGISLATTIDLAFAVGAELEAFDLQVTGLGSTIVEGTIDFASTTHWAWGEEKPYERVLFRRAYALGPLPIVVVAKLDANLAATAYVEEPVTFTNGATSDLVVDAHTRYRPGAGWVVRDASTMDVAQLGPVHDGVGRASLAVGIDPRIAIAFYGVAGPEIQIAAQAGGFGAYCGPALLVGLQAALQGSVAFELDALVRTDTTRVTLFEQRVLLDELEQCVP